MSSIQRRIRSKFGNDESIAIVQAAVVFRSGCVAASVLLCHSSMSVERSAVDTVAGLEDRPSDEC